MLRRRSGSCSAQTVRSSVSLQTVRSRWFSFALALAWLLRTAGRRLYHPLRCSTSSRRHRLVVSLQAAISRPAPRAWQNASATPADNLLQLGGPGRRVSCLRWLGLLRLSTASLCNFQTFPRRRCEPRSEAQRQMLCRRKGSRCQRRSASVITMLRARLVGWILVTAVLAPHPFRTKALAVAS